jgi:hypothetical protein
MENEKANEPFVKKTVMQLPLYDLKTPAVIVGAGYGIDEQIPLLTTEKDVVVIATDKANPHFVKLGVCPDYIVALNTEETPEVKVGEWFRGVERNSRLVLPVTAHPSHMRHWTEVGGGEVFWMVPLNIDPDLSEEWAKKYNCPAMNRGANSGEFAFQVAAMMRCSPVGLIGMPYAWKTLVEALKGQLPENYEYHEFCQDGKHCYTTLAFMEQRTEFLELVRMSRYVWETSETGFSNLIPWIKAYNCSEGGILYDAEVLPRMTLEKFLEDFA